MGFFFANQPKPTTKGGGQGGTAAKKVAVRKVVIPIQERGRKSAGCSACTLNGEYAQTLTTPRMKPTGSDEPVIYMLGEAPGKTEDEYGEQFIGRSGEMIRDFIPEELERYVRWNNTVRCRPPGNRTPTQAEVVCCSQYQVHDIEETKPLVVMGFGNVPLQWATEQSGITDWRGLLVPVRIGTHVCWYASLWHPAYILRMKEDKKMGTAMLDAYKRDLARVFDAVLRGELPEPQIPEGEALDAGMHWELSWDLEAVEGTLAHMSQQYPIQAIDIETNDLRPYSKDARILTIAFGTWEHSYAIPVRHRESKWDDGQVRRLWRIIGKHMRQPGITFVAHHLKFEQEWLSMPSALGRDILFEVKWGDTMAQAEVLRTQSLQAKSLDARCVAMFGVPEKSLDDIDRTRLDSFPLPQVLRYNARDVKFTDLLRQSQEPLIEQEGLQAAYEMMVTRSTPLTIAQQQGVVPNHEFVEAKHLEILAQIEALEAKVQALPDVRAMVLETRKPFNSGSPAQLATLFRDRLKLKEGWRMVDGVRKYSVDEETLEKVKHPIATLILEQRSLRKMDGTYVLGLCRKGTFADKKCGKLVWDDGLIHTNYNYLKTTTGRTSSDEPNLQNFPKHEFKEIRNGIMAALRYLIASIDYGQIEARVIAMASQCPVLCKSLWDHYDIHMDWAKRISKAFDYVLEKYAKEVKGDEEKALKKFRQDVKNQWTFPLFFGSRIEPVADVLDIPVRKLQPYYDEFWDMFVAVKRWQNKLMKTYRDRGFTETLTGRRRYEPLSLNEVINSPVQGTASDIVIHSMERLAQRAYETKLWHLAPRMNVHDDLTFNLPEASIDSDLETIIPIMLTPRFDFINVPLTVELSIGKTWGVMEDVVTVESTDFGFPSSRSH